MILLVIDMQKGLVDEDLYAFDTLMDRTVRLVDAARKNNIEVIFVQHDAGPDSGMSEGDEAFEIIDQIAPKEGEKSSSRQSTVALAIATSEITWSSRKTNAL